MTSLATKQQILDSAGYDYNFDREVYFNRSTKKIFSIDFLEQNDGPEIERSINEKTNGRGWRFYFLKEPAQSVKRQIMEALG